MQVFFLSIVIVTDPAFPGFSFWRLMLMIGIRIRIEGGGLNFSEISS